MVMPLAGLDDIGCRGRSGDVAVSDAVLIAW
jgi:hypothetical protein